MDGTKLPIGVNDASGVATGLSGLRVLDLGRYIAGPFCAALLADHGAEVIRIEPPTGAPDREVMPIGQPGRGALYLQMNRNKKSLALDLDSATGRAAFEKLVATADAVIVNLPPAALRRARLDYDSLKAIRPDIVLCTISAYGPEGDSRDRIGFDGTGQALSGAMALSGTGERPLRAAVSYVDYATGMSAAFATLAALYERRGTGRGQHVQASLLGTALTMTNPMLIEEAAGARSRKPIGNRSPIAGPSDLFQTSDGWLMIQVIGDGMFRRWAEFVGRPDLLVDARFASDIGRGENGEALSAVMADWCSLRSSDECLAELEAAKIPACRALTPAEALMAPENAKGGFFSLEPAPKGASQIPIVANAVRTAALRPKHRPAPKLGADSAELLASLGYEPDEIAGLTGSGTGGTSHR
ncbi:MULTISPECIES: CoA transferase [Hyphomicrobiales]|uniref:CaiB/BaiF CoA transferase family protein n=1 Tax=Methylobacterium sp. CCH7-A2 TaxID=1768789 RepID=UPI000AA29EE5|nr:MULTISPECIES: CoA transferase [Hyphomicrobiales]